MTPFALLGLLAMAGVTPASAPVQRLTFGEDLNLGEDSVMRGARAWQTVVLPRPRAWALTADPVVHVRFRHAPTLDAARSSITLLLDDRPVASAPLTVADAAGGELVATLPRASLHDYNRLTVHVVQHESDGCETPFGPSLWTRLSADSFVELPGRAAPQKLELLDFPAPLWDPLGTGPLRLTPVLPGGLGASSLQAAGELGFALGRLADWRGVEIAPPVDAVARAETPALVIGTPEENPSVSALVDTSGLGPHEGLLALVRNPARPALAVLVVTGGSGDGVLAAARALLRDDRAQRVGGATARVRGTVDGGPPASVRRPRPMVPEGVTLADLGIQDHTAVGLFGAALEVPLMLEGDGRARPGGAVLTVHYAYGAGLDPRLSTIEVRVDGVGVRSALLDVPEGEQEATLRVSLPSELLHPSSRVQVSFNLFPEGMAECGPLADDQLWGTVFARSELQIARDHAAVLPDLGLLRHRLWPMTAEAEGEQLSVLVADQPGGAEVAAAMQVASALGARAFSGAAPRFLAGTSAAMARGLVLLLASEDQVNAARHRDERLPESAPWDGLFVQTQPGGPGTTRLALAARDRGDLLDLARMLGDDQVVAKLTGSRMAWTRDDGLRPLDPVGSTWVRRGATLSRARSRLQEHGSMAALFAMPGVLAAAMVVSRWARRRGGIA